MRRKLAAGNWKMNGTQADLAMLDALAANHADNACDVAICLPSYLLIPAATATANGPISVGAQDCHAAAKGAYTGDTAAQMIADAGAAYVIVGHSERRDAHTETDAQVRAKAEAAQSENLTAIVCIGESLAQRDAGDAISVITTQLAGSVPDGSDANNLVVAYEPIWAIGTGKIPTMEQIAEVHAKLRQELAARFGPQIGNGIRLLYGGSVKPDNAAAIFALSDVDGALVGGASLKADDFSPIITALADS